MSALQQLLRDYLAGSKLLRDAVAGMSAEQVRAKPIAGKWSTLEVVCHLADFEPIFADRMKRVIAEERPSLASADENRFFAALVYDRRDLEEELRIVELTRSQFGKVLATLPDSALQRVGIHSERGELTLEKLLQSAINHVQHHVKFIHEKRQAMK